MHSNLIHVSEMLQSYDIIFTGEAAGLWFSMEHHEAMLHLLMRLVVVLELGSKCEELIPTAGAQYD